MTVNLDWQLIETAPKDGTVVLFTYWGADADPRFHGSMPVVSGYWSMLSEDWYSPFSSTGRLRPTHWMPLPEPPTLTAAHRQP